MYICMYTTAKVFNPIFSVRLNCFAGKSFSKHTLFMGHLQIVDCFDFIPPARKAESAAAIPSQALRTHSHQQVKYFCCRGSKEYATLKTIMNVISGWNQSLLLTVLGAQIEYEKKQIFLFPY